MHLRLILFWTPFDTPRLTNHFQTKRDMFISCFFFSRVYFLLSSSVWCTERVRFGRKKNEHKKNWSIIRCPQKLWIHFSKLIYSDLKSQSRLNANLMIEWTSKYIEWIDFEWWTRRTFDRNEVRHMVQVELPTTRIAKPLTQLATHWNSKCFFFFHFCKNFKSTKINKFHGRMILKAICLSCAPQVCRRLTIRARSRVCVCVCIPVIRCVSVYSQASKQARVRILGFSLHLNRTPIKTATIHNSTSIGHPSRSSRRSVHGPFVTTSHVMKDDFDRSTRAPHLISISVSHSLWGCMRLPPRNATVSDFSSQIYRFLWRFEWAMKVHACHDTFVALDLPCVSFSVVYGTAHARACTHIATMRWQIDWSLLSRANSSHREYSTQHIFARAALLQRCHLFDFGFCCFSRWTLVCARAFTSYFKKMNS